MRPGCSCTQAELCAECLEADYGTKAGVAMLRGELWARRAIIFGGRDRRLRWYPHVGKAAARARELVADLAADPRLLERLAEACSKQAARTWATV